jgi:hypothetical protein
MPPPGGAMKYLSEKIPKDTLKRIRLYGNGSRDKTPVATPQLPDFLLALKAEAFILPPVDRAWEAVSSYQPPQSPITKGSTFLTKKQEVKPLPGFDLRRQPALSIPEYVQAR